jgi:hypothetical protein
MQIVTLDYESFWSQSYSLSKMSPLEYVLGDEFEVISCSIKYGAKPTQVFFGHDDIAAEFERNKMVINTSMLIAHNNSGFDAYISKFIFGLTPKMWGCTQAMARPVYAKTVGLSLAKLVKHYGLGVKNNAVLMATKGKHLADFTADELRDMETYNKEDTDQCYALFQKLAPHHTAAELWQIDALTRMRVEPAFKVDQPMLHVALSMERDQKRKHILMLAKHLKKSGLASEAIQACATVEALEEAVRVELASAPKFSALLESLGVPTPMKPSPTNPDKEVPALAKTDEAFTDMTEHDNPIVAAAARARLSVKSTLLETRIGKFLTASGLLEGMLPVPLRYCGAETTGRDSGEEYNPQNLPRVNTSAPKISDSLRNCLKTRKGETVIVADQSGIEMRVNHFLWKVISSMALYQQNAEADLYKAFAAVRYKKEVGDVTKAERQLAKVAQLGLGFGCSWKTFMRVAKTMGGLDLAPEEAESITDAWRTQYAEIVRGWKVSGGSLARVQEGSEYAVDPWGMVTTCAEGLRLPSDRLIRYPNLRQVDGKWPDGRPRREWIYGDGRHKTNLHGAKVTENIVQALARDTVFDCAIDFYKTTKLRPALRVHDELVYVVPEAEADSLLAELQRVMRTSPKWWPELIVHSEGDTARSYGTAK